MLLMNNSRSMTEETAMPAAADIATTSSKKAIAASLSISDQRIHILGAARVSPVA
jgi:hypothetical protein